jgi:hypothetical protein
MLGKCPHWLVWLVRILEKFHQSFNRFVLGNAMTQIGVGIGVNKASIKLSIDQQNLTKTISNNSENVHQKINLHQKLSSNSSERRNTNDVADDENSNSFESHSDEEKKFPKTTLHNRRGMSVNWGSNSTTAVNLTSTRTPPYRRPMNHKNVKSFAHSLYRNPIRLSGLSSTKTKSPIISTQPTVILTPISSEPEPTLCRVSSRPQPRPESLATMSDELFHERLKARQSPLLAGTDLPQQTTLIVDHHLSPSTVSDKTPTEDIDQSDQPSTDEKSEENLIEINSSPSIPRLQLQVEEIVNNIDESSDDSWRLLNSNSSLDIPYIDETDFEDLGKVFHGLEFTKFCFFH